MKCNGVDGVDGARDAHMGLDGVRDVSDKGF